METFFGSDSYYWVLGIVAFMWSFYQGWAGLQYGLYIIDNTVPGYKEKHRKKRWWAYGFQHGGMYFVCTLSGFFALHILFYFMSYPKLDWANISIGLGTVLVALFTFIVLGISGTLGRLVYFATKIKDLQP